MIRLILIAVTFAGLLVPTAHAGPVRFHFEGILPDASRLNGFTDDFTPSGRFRGSYTVDPERATALTDTPNTVGSSIEYDYIHAITGWRMNFVGGGFRFAGDTGNISLGNDDPNHNNTAFFDRYTPTMFTSPGADETPSSDLLWYFQIDLIVLSESPSDLLTSDALPTYAPDLSLLTSQSPRARFKFRNGDEFSGELRQLRVTPVSAPASSILLLVGLSMVAFLAFPTTRWAAPGTCPIPSYERQHPPGSDDCRKKGIG